MGSRAADCSITYHMVAEEMAMAQGIAGRREYAWRDHWLLVGRSCNDDMRVSFGMSLSLLMVSRTKRKSRRSAP